MRQGGAVPAAAWQPPTGAPSATLRLWNFAVFQAAWFAAVLGAAHQVPLWGTACVIAAVAWHLAVSARPAVEARLVGAACVVGLLAESGVVAQGFVAYPSGQPVSWLAPYWVVALWGLLAMSLNVTLRWLKGRWWLAAALGGVAGPLSFAGGARLGGARVLEAAPAFATLALMWCALMPLLVWLSSRFDGVASPAMNEGEFDVR